MFLRHVHGGIRTMINGFIRVIRGQESRISQITVEYIMKITKFG